MSATVLSKIFGSRNNRLIKKMMRKVVKINALEMEYHSPRGFSDLAHGLINGAIDLFGEEADLEEMSCD